VVALPLLIAFIYYGSEFQFVCLIFVLSLLGLDEFYRMALPGRRVDGMLAAGAGALLPLAAFYLGPVGLLFTLTLLGLVFAILLLFRFNEIRQAATETALLLMGFFYVPLLLTHLSLLRGVPDGVQWIFLLMVIVMASDTAAYYVGSTLGRRKLYPAVSPNKSVEGALGGLAGAIAGAFLSRATFFPGLTLLDCLAIPLLLGGLAQLGDLFESLLKRSCGVKDSGRIIPGHGGILDRLDSILFAAPAAFYYAYLIFYQR
jgi:phosphatidate cytidylyltransferase